MSTTKRASATDSKVRKNETQPAEAATGVDESGQSLDKVRDILFGANMRTYEDRLEQLEQRMLDEVAQLRQNADAKFEQLESSFRKELSALGDRLQSEKDERTAEASTLQHDLKGVAESLEARLGQLESRLTESGDGLSGQIREQTEALSAQLQQAASDITSRFEHELQLIRAAKPDTAALASMFAELAERLRNDHPTSD